MSPSRIKQSTVFLLVILGLMASPGIVFGASKSERESLKGMSGVLVSVDVKKQSLETHGITEAMLKTDIEMKLRVARIKVFDNRNDPDLDRTGRPELFISVVAIKFDPAAVYVFLISLTQDVNLSRGKTPVRATTWIRMGESHGGVDDAHEGIRKKIGDGVDAFINDYLAANPK